MASGDPVGIATALVAILTLPLGLLVALFVSAPAAAAVFIVGWLLLVPTIPIVGNELLEIGRSDETDEDPIEALKQRYVDGELTEEEFSERLDQLLETGDEQETSGNDRGDRARSTSDEAVTTE